MPKMRLTGLTLLAAVLLTLPGCVELTGQRITWFYDAVEDELRILIHYDGIHDSGSGDKGTEQVPKFVENGNVMIFDWPFHLETAEVREALDNESTNPREKEWARLIASIETKPVGYYREPNGRIGAAQLVTIPKAKQFVRNLNDLINKEVGKEIREEMVHPDDPLARTFKRMRAAAGKDHQWVQLEGHAIRLTLPVHADEWAVAKGKFLQDAARELAKAFGEKGSKEARNSANMVLKALASVPVSYIDKGDRVTFVVGRREVPCTVRLDIREEYEPSLEKVVRGTVKVDLDKAAAAALLDDGADRGPGLAAVLSFGPPEERVRALLVAADTQCSSKRRAAIEQLQSWATQWNRDRGVPEAPQDVDQPEDYLAQWKKWYARVK